MSTRQNIYSSLVALVAFAVFIPVVAAAPWDQVINNPSRFTLVMPGGCSKLFKKTCIPVLQAVRDNETGLVWERSPGDTNGDGIVDFNDDINWQLSASRCNAKVVGNRLGWRLPTLQELRSLVDPTQDTPALPAGHPFLNVRSALSPYWSATTVAGNTSNAWAVLFSNDDVINGDKTLTNFAFVWCLRGGQGVNPQ